MRACRRTGHRRQLGLPGRIVLLALFALLGLNEGRSQSICDRNAEIQKLILAQLSGTACGAVTGQQLAGITELDASNNQKGLGIASLRAADFAGLVNLVHLDLRHNDLTELPAGLFQVLNKLKIFRVDHNPETGNSGATGLRINFKVVRAGPDTADGTPVKVRVVQGAPVQVTVGVWATERELTSDPPFSTTLNRGRIYPEDPRVTIKRGALESDVATVKRPGPGQSWMFLTAMRADLNTCDLSSCWSGSFWVYTPLDLGTETPMPTPTPTPRPNRPPSVSASCDPCEVSPGGEVRLKAMASDPDGDQLSYRWSAKEGSFLSFQDRATTRWQAPPVAGRYRVQVEVFDRSGASDSATVEINVNSPPTVSLSCEERCRVRQGLSVRLEATASDPDGHELSYSWSAGSGRFIGETDTATARWRAPAEAGPMAVRVTVSDGQGGSASAEVDVEVDPLSNQSAVFASYLVSMPSEDPDQVIDTYLSVSNVLSAPERVATAGGPYEGDDKVGTLEIHLYDRDGGGPVIHETTGDSPGAGLDENGRLAPGQTYTVRLAEIVGEDRAFVGYGWIVGNFDGIAGTRTNILGQGVTWHGDLSPKLSRHGAGVKPIPPLE